MIFRLIYPVDNSHVLYYLHMQVTIYSTPTCPYCKLTKDFLDDRGVDYTEIDVSADPAKANEMVKKSGQMGVPVVDIDGKIIVGWNKSALAETLGLKEEKVAA